MNRVRAHANLHTNLRASSFGPECPALTRRIPIVVIDIVVASRRES